MDRTDSSRPAINEEFPRKEITTDTTEYKRGIDALSNYYHRRCTKLLEIESKIANYSISYKDIIPLIDSELDNLREEVEKEKENATRCFASLTDSRHLADDKAAAYHLYDADTEDPLATFDGEIYRDVREAIDENYIGSEEAERRSDRLMELRNIISSEWNSLERDIQQRRNLLVTSVIAISSLITILLTIFNFFII